MERVQNRTPEFIIDSSVPQIMEEGLPVVPQERVQNRTPEQIVGVLVPQIIEECVQNRTQEQIAAFPVPQISEERVPGRTPEQIMDFPVSQNKEAYTGRVRDFPLERVQNRSFVRPKRVFVDFLPLHSACKPYTGKVFTVNLRHHRDDQAFSDCVRFIKGLDKHDMPRLGDVMVPPPQITKISWFDGKSFAAANEPLYRFHQRYSAAPSSSGELRFQHSGVGRARLCARQFLDESVVASQLQFFSWGSCCSCCLDITSGAPC